MFRNRITRMAKHWKKWARKRNIECFRIYDRDIPQVPVCVDLYGPLCHISVYKNNYEISDEDRVKESEEISKIICEILSIHPNQIFWKKENLKKVRNNTKNNPNNLSYLRLEKTDLDFM
ncbi:hypothetical protein LEP1GSC083_0412 [Leptospira interrogans serovar Pyrogenes str. L0374]|uniref:S-adenosylmethionine-dependent methyltransferase domain protein n=1 Tax=Leptospira interrogans serovar Pyrogenes str. L0374 TaxID=1049928 RepID=M6KFR1_LEPIR|nr:hypothetical protein LEP1GSC083_0412 [Leptospira interrogans serovar Pyrogenes str. L0374]